MDPMQIKPELRDRLPKAKLESGYLGDTYPVCEELPQRPFLLEGAIFEYTGSSSAEGYILDSEVGRGRLSPVPGSSALYRALCAPRASDGTCSFPLRVVLSATLPCNGAQECGAGRVRTVRIVDPLANVTKYYNFKRGPCVHLTFFDSGKVIKSIGWRSQCADPARTVGAGACCNSSLNLIFPVGNYTSECLFSNEAITYQTNQQRCESMGLTTCSGGLWSGSTFQTSCAEGVRLQLNPTPHNSNDNLLPCLRWLYFFSLLAGLHVDIE
jgi:hypothetical protein